MNDYAKVGGPGVVWLLCSFYHEPLRTRIETDVNTYTILNHTVLKIDLHTLISYLRLICEYELYILPNKKVGAAKDHDKNYMWDRPPLVAIFCVMVYFVFTRNCITDDAIKFLHFSLLRIRLDMHCMVTYNGRYH